jgi:hypothetical protein
MSPAIGDYIEDARHTKAKEDVEAIGFTIVRLQRDVGSCLRVVAVDPCTMANRVDILKSSGPDVAAGDLGTSAVDFSSADITPNSINWDDDDVAQVGDTMINQFVANVPAYLTPADSTPTGYTLSGPQAGLGWRGAYITPPIGTDPWGSVYLANTAFLVVATDATDGTLQGNRRGGWSRDTFVISAGPNGQYDTPYGGTTTTTHGVVIQGDDLVYVVRGDTR